MEGKRQLEKRDFGKRLSLDSSLMEYMDSNKYIEHLLTQLEEQHRSLWREKLAVARLQREVAQRRSEGAMHEKLIHELEEERHLRLQSEKRLQEVTLESERNRIQMRGLQQQFSRMEETVRNLLQSQGSPEQKKEETVNMMVYQEKLSAEARIHKETLEDLHMVVDEDSRSEGSSVDEGKEKTRVLLERLKALEAENSALALENENQREQYERCLDEVANQVVQALLTQKDLREECVKLKTRVFDLEQQNRTLSILFQQRVRPASDLLLQKLHSRILDLSSGDLLSDVERSQSLTHSGSDAEMHECQLNTKPGAPALKCPGVGVAIPGHLCPRNSCSSSELSLSSACSEYSSGSSYTWHDGKNLRKRQSSQNWDKRLSIDSSLPSGFASPTDELPPTRVKESHILEGLRKLQKRKVLLEPPSVITKWGYKDCMNSNEGIYSPGIKSSSLKEYAPCKPRDTGSPCKEPQPAFVYDTDSHDDAEEDPSSLASLQAAPKQSFRLHGCKLTHSVSDSLFGWEPNGRHCSEIPSSVHSRERPEKLTGCASNCPLGQKLWASVQGPRVYRGRGPQSQGCLAVHLQLSDTDDTESLDELHIASSDEKSPSDVSLTVDTDKSSEHLDILMGFRKSQPGSPEEEEEKQVTVHLESRPKTFSFIKQQRVVKRTSSEECITVIFDAEDGEPIEFSSHQTDVVTVTRKEISINQAPSGPQAERAELLPQGIAHLQPGAAARNHSFLKKSEEETEKNIPKDEADGVAMAPTGSLLPRAVTQSAQRERLARPTHATPCRSNSKSSGSTGIYQKKSLTKIPTKGKSSPQKSKIMVPEASITVPSTGGPVTLEKSPSPGKLSRFKRTEGPALLFDLPPESHIPKHPAQAPHGSKGSSRRDGVQRSKGQKAASPLLSRPPVELREDCKPPTRDKRCDREPEAGVKSPSPPSPPGRSVSLLIRPSYDYWPPPSSTQPETRVPQETARTGFKSPPLKGPSAPVIYFHQTVAEAQGKKPSVAFKKPVFTPAPPSAETVVQARCSAHTPSSSFAAMAPGPPKVSPKRSVPKTPPHQTLGTTQADTGSRTPRNCPSTHEPLEIPSPKSLSPGKKGQLNDSVSTSPKPSLLGVNESPSSQVNSPASSASSKSHNTPHGGPNPQERGLKTRLPVGLKVFTKSPQLLRKSSTVPGKHEKDSLNEASRSSGAGSQAKPEASRNPSSPEITGAERNASPLALQAQGSVAGGLPLDTAMVELLENGRPGADRKDGVEARSVKMSLSSSKPHLKPALGMNGAKARSQSFSAHSGDKPPTPPMEGPGRVRTQIITNTAERGSSLTRQSSSPEVSPHKATSAPASDDLPSTGRPPGHPFSRHGSLESTGSSSSQHGSPSKLLLRVPPKSEGSLAPPGTEDLQACAQGESPGVPAPEEPGGDRCRCPPAPRDSPRALQSPGRTQPPGNFEISRTPKLETSGKDPDPSPTRTGVVSPEAPLSPTIEEKVMLCIQENVEKGQVHTKSTSVEAKLKPGPSFASWFGFRRSRLPALSSRKMDVSKTKAEKKDAKGLGFGNKQLKSERKKEKKKPELQCEMENELHRDVELADGPESGLQSRNNLKTPPDSYDQMKFELRSRPSPVAGSTKDSFMTELLNRVDKKAAQQMESGSNTVSCRSVLKGSSQGPCLPGSSTSTQGNHRKNIKTKAEMEIPRGSLIKEANEDLPEDEEDTVADAAFQSHAIETNCQMRTLDSGIGTFPLPDSGNRSTGRYTCQPDSPEDTESILPLQPALCTASSIKAQTPEREVPSSADSQNSAENTIVHSTSDTIVTARRMLSLQSCLPKPPSSGKINSQMENEAEPRPQTCSSFEYAEDTMVSGPLPAWGGDSAAAETQDKLPRMCAYSASGGSDSDNEPDYGNNGFGTGRGKLVKAMKSTTPEIETS
uniref:NCK associated protein 5 n=1 Tax=Catagonus wagneri TaxID=51154 RepID=A0A8C3YS33_9CETA